MLIQIGMDDDVGYSGFIFQGKEDKSEGCSRTLAGDDATSARDPTAVGLGQKFFGTEHAGGAEVRSAIGHGMVIDGESRSGVIGDEALVGLHLAQR